MKPLFTLRTLFLILSLAIGLVTLGQADSNRLENLSLKQLLEVKVTTASKTLQEVGLAPATVVMVTKEQIRARGYQSLLDLLYDLPEMKVDDKIYSGIRNTFTLRGTQGTEKFILLLDGIRISTPSGEALPIMENYPVNLAERVEVVYGPASALYGADAVSGVINIITRRLPDRKSISVEAQTAGGSYGYSNTSLFLAKRLGEHTDLTISGQYAYDPGADYSKLYRNDSDLNIAAYRTGVFNTIYGPVTPSTPVVPKYQAPMTAHNVYAGLHMDDFSVTFFRSYSRVPTAFGNNTSNAIYNKDVFMAQSVNTCSGVYKRSFGTVTSTTSLMASEYDLNPRSNYRNLYTAMEPVYKYSTSTEVRGEQQIDYKPSEKIGITAGADYERYNTIPQSMDLDAPVNTHDYIHGIMAGTRTFYHPDGLPAPFYFIKYNNAGAYSQVLLTPSRNWHFTLGARYEDNSRYGSSFTPRAGVVFNVSPGTTVKFLYGSSYLAPSPSDSYVQYGAFDTPDSGRTYHASFLHLANPGLKPIRSKNLELNFRHNLTDNLMLTMNGYYTVLRGLHGFADDNSSTHLYHNMFNGIPVDYIEVFVNNNRQKNYGGNVQLSWKFRSGEWQVSSLASLSYVNGVFESGLSERTEAEKDVQLDFISPFMAHLQVDARIRKWSFSPRIIWMSAQHINGYADTTGSTIKRQTIPGYLLMNVSVRYSAGKRFSFFTNVTNALNERYRNVTFNMDLNKHPSEIPYGQRQDPIRVTSGLTITL